MSDMVAYGARCMWWDDKDNVGIVVTRDGHRLPCCPHCKRVLFEMPRKQWDEAVAAHATNTPDYPEVLEFSRGKCYESFADVRAAYAEHVRELKPDGSV